MKQFKIPIFFILVYIFLFQSCHIFEIPVLKGNGNIITKEIPISDYQRIEIFANPIIVYEQKPEKEPYFRINIDDNLLPLLDIHIKNGKLTINIAQKINL